MPYDNTDLCQQWFGLWLIAWRHQVLYPLLYLLYVSLQVWCGKGFPTQVLVNTSYSVFFIPLPAIPSYYQAEDTTEIYICHNICGCSPKLWSSTELWAILESLLWLSMACSQAIGIYSRQVTGHMMSQDHLMLAAILENFHCEDS